MYGTRQKQVDEILNAIDHGRLSQEETERRLQGLIDREIYKQSGPADLRLLDSCYQLLGLLHGIQLQHIDSCKIVHNAIQKYNRYCHRVAMWKRFGRLAAVLVIILGISLVPVIRWITTEISDDNEQYVVKGHRVDIQTVAFCVSIHSQYDSIVSSTWNDIVEFLGYEPYVVYPREWSINEYKCYIFPECISLFLHGNNMQGQAITICYDMYAAIEDMVLVVELSEDSSTVNVQNHLVYCITNLDSDSYIWTEDNITITVHGSVTLEEIASMIRKSGGN